MKHVRFVAAALLLLVMGTSARSADISLTGTRGVYLLEGEITTGDTLRLEQLIRENPQSAALIYLRSPGGDFYESMKLGRALRNLEFATIVPTARGPSAVCDDPLTDLKEQRNCTCASACVFVHMGGIHKSGTYLVAHRPYFSKGAFGQLNAIDAEKLFSKLQSDARKYMEEMSIPVQVREDILSTPSHQGFQIDEKTVSHYFSGYLPARQEWLRNRCSSLNADEEAELLKLSKAANARRGAAFEESLGAEGAARLRALLKPYIEYSNCTMKANDELKSASHKRYFLGK